jgi:hypothetical protein
MFRPCESQMQNDSRSIIAKFYRPLSIEHHVFFVLQQGPILFGSAAIKPAFSLNIF